MSSRPTNALSLWKGTMEDGLGLFRTRTRIWPLLARASIVVVGQISIFLWHIIEDYVQKRAATTLGAFCSNRLSSSRTLAYPRSFLLSNLTIIEWSAFRGIFSPIKSGSWRRAESVSTAVIKSPVLFQRLLLLSYHKRISDLPVPYFYQHIIQTLVA
jgi:hypothetical protein